MPCSISGTKFCGSLTNFFIGAPLSSSSLRSARRSRRRRWPRRRPIRGCARPCRRRGHVSRPARPSRRPRLARVAAARSRTSSLLAPDASVSSMASVIGTSASSSVLSPSSAPPRAMMPSTADRSIATTAAPSSSVASPAVMPARMNAVPQIGPDVPPIREVISMPDLLQESADVGAVEFVVLGLDLLEAASQGVAEVAVADHRVEVAEVLLVGQTGAGDGLHDEVDVDPSCRSCSASFACDTAGRSVPAPPSWRGLPG